MQGRSRTVLANPRRSDQATVAVKRVPASLAVVWLAASGHPVSPITLRSWVHRGHISRQEGGYDLAEIVKYSEIRENRMKRTYDVIICGEPDGLNRGSRVMIDEADIVPSM